MDKKVSSLIHLCEYSIWLNQLLDTIFSFIEDLYFLSEIILKKKIDFDEASL